MGDDRAGTDGYIAPDSYTRAYRNIAAYPYIVAHMDGLGIFQSFIALLHVERMTCRIEGTARSYEDIITEGNLCLVEDDAIGIGEEMVANFYVITIVTEERCHDNEAVAGLPEEFLQPAEPLLTVVWLAVSGLSQSIPVHSGGVLRAPPGHGWHHRACQPAVFLSLSFYFLYFKSDV